MKLYHNRIKNQSQSDEGSIIESATRDKKYLLNILKKYHNARDYLII